MGAPVRFTCPTIDRIITNLRDIMNQIEDDFPDEANQISSMISSRGEMEEIRDANNSLRNWGHDSETKIDELETELSQANDTISDLEQQLNNVE